MIKILNKNDYKALGINNVKDLIKYIKKNYSILTYEDELSLIISTAISDLDTSYVIDYKEIEDTKTFKKQIDLYIENILKEDTRKTNEEAREDLEIELQNLETLTINEYVFELMDIRLLELSDEEKIAYLNGEDNQELDIWKYIYINKQHYDIEYFLKKIITSLKNDEEKIKFLNNDLIEIIFKKKINEIDKTSLTTLKYGIIKSFQQEKSKVKYLRKIILDNTIYSDQYGIEEILRSLKDENLILECLKDEKILEELDLNFFFEIEKSLGIITKIQNKKNIKELIKIKQFSKIIENHESWTEEIKNKNNISNKIKTNQELNDNEIIDAINETVRSYDITRRASLSIQLYLFIKLLSNQDLIQECLKNEKILRILGSSGIKSIILNFENKDLIIELLSNNDVIEKLYNNDIIEIIETLPQNKTTIEKITNLLSNPIFSDKIISIQSIATYKRILPYFEEHIREVFLKCVSSNSIEIEKLGFSMIIGLYSQKLTKEEINNNFIEMENIFLKNNIPYFGKMFLCFQKIYPNLSKKEGNIEKFDFKDTSRMSPTLQDDFIMRLLYRNKYEEKKKEIEESLTKKEEFDKKATMIRFVLIFNNLLWISIGSNNRSLREYLDNIEKGNELYLQIINGNIDLNDLNTENKKILNEYISHLEMLYANTKDSKEENIDLTDKNILEKIEIFKEKFKVTEKYSLPDRIVRSFCYYAGFDSFKQLQDTLDAVAIYSNEKNKRNKQSIQGKKLILEEGDFIRGIGSIDSLKSLDEGNVCKELLGTITGISGSDTTPLDTDWTRLMTKDIKDNIHDTIEGTPTGFGFGDIFFVIKKDNPNLFITREPGNNLQELQYQPNKVSMFSTGYDSHYGAQIGTPTNIIDYIIFNENYENYRGNIFKNKNGGTINKLSALKIEIAKKGIYIPIVNIEGELIFDELEYENLRNKIGGLKHYNCPIYKISDYSLELPNVQINLENGHTINIPSVEEMLPIIKENNTKNESRKKAIFKTLSKFIIDNSSAKVVYDKMTGDLTDGIAELLGTGSTSRGTNIPGDADYDFILRLDKKELLKNSKLSSNLKTYLKPKSEISGKSNRFRGMNINSIPNFENIDFDIDVTFIGKTNKMEYSTEMALTERLNAIKEQYPEQYDIIISNIVIAKYLLKSAGVYKSSKSDPKQGGLGGVGIENWILQNNGSLEQAIDEFLKYSIDEKGNQLSFEEFKKNYHIWDFGANHESDIPKYPYDDFVEFNMTEEGYKKMCTVIKLYKEQLEHKKSSHHKK